MRTTLLTILLFCLSFSGCQMLTPPQEIRTAIELIHSASQDISDHNLELSRERLGELIVQLKEEEEKTPQDRDKIRDLKKRIAEETENISALKELPLALQDLSSWAKGE